MPTYLYCLLTPEADPDGSTGGVHGIDGGPARVLSTAALEAWVSTVAAPSPAATVNAVREHDRVVSAALSTGRTPLPARFGQVWPSDEDCIAAVTERAGEFQPMLRRVAGLVEMTVYAQMRPAPPAPAPSPESAGEVTRGRAYLEGLRARADRERALRTALEVLRDRLGRALGPIARGEVAEIRSTDQSLGLSISYLVERRAEADFRAVIDDVSHEAADRLVVAGPRAPYSFALAGHATRDPRTARLSGRT